MTPVRLFSPEAARGWVPWAWLSPLLLVFFVAAPVIALDGWMQSRQWSTPRGDPIGLAGLYALLWIGFAPTLLAVFAWVSWVERRSLASIGLGGSAPLRRLAFGIGVGIEMFSVILVVFWVCVG